MKNGLILEVKNLSVVLDHQRIIENLSFEVEKGDVLTILGPNGAGKSVLLKTLMGLFPYKGKIEWAKELKIGYVPQRLPFIKDIPLNIRDFFSLKGSPERETEAILKSVGFQEEFLLKK
jgi:zinc transport system ATP-binding protein